MNDKRQEIIDKVMDLFLKFGIRSVTMDDIVREVGISKKTLYQFFKDKTELVAAVLSCQRKYLKEEHCEAMEGAINAIDEMMKMYDFQMKMIKDYNPSLFYDLKKYYPEIHNESLEKKRKGIYDGVLANLEKGKKEGLYRQELDEKIIARLNLMRVEAFIHSGIFNNEEIMTKSFFSEMFMYHMYGIVSEEGRRILEQNIDKLK